MRYIDPILKSRIEKPNQTIYENANPAMLTWISRHSIPLINQIFLQRIKIGQYTNISGVSVAARRPKINRQPDRIFVAFTDNGVGRILYMNQISAIEDRLWLEAGVINDAIDVAIVFDGYMIKTIRNGMVFKTVGDVPWIFWIDSTGILYGQILNDTESPTIISTASAVSAIRGIRNINNSQDQGIIVFFVQNGNVYYTQYINNTWDGVQSITGLPENIIVDVSAARTLDYRIVVQCLASDGTLYEIFTNIDSLGLGTGYDYISAAITDIDIHTHPITYQDGFNTDSLSVGLSDLLISVKWGLSPVPQSILNLDAFTIQITFDHELSNATGQQAGFTVKDNKNIVFATIATSLTDNLTLILTCNDFNNASGDMTVIYNSSIGSIQGEAVALNSFTLTFTPTGLVPSIKEPPVPVLIYNAE